MAYITTRYGHSQTVDDPSDEWITSKLIRELRTELAGHPDNEHTQVSVGNEHWSVTADVSGLVIFDNLDLLEGESSDLPESMYLRDLPDAQLISIWQAVVRGEQAALLAHPWQQSHELPVSKRDYYRLGDK